MIPFLIIVASWAVAFVVITVRHRLEYKRNIKKIDELLSARIREYERMLSLK